MRFELWEHYRGLEGIKIHISLARTMDTAVPSTLRRATRSHPAMARNRLTVNRSARIKIISLSASRPANGIRQPTRPGFRSTFDGWRNILFDQAKSTLFDAGSRCFHVCKRNISDHLSAYVLPNERFFSFSLSLCLFVWKKISFVKNGFRNEIRTERIEIGR